jgi:hypothetical protein
MYCRQIPRAILCGEELGDIDTVAWLGVVAEPVVCLDEVVTAWAEEEPEVAEEPAAAWRLGGMRTAGGCNGKYMIESRYGLAGHNRDVELCSLQREACN